MTALLHLAARAVTKADVECAQTAHFALIRAEAADPRLLDDPAHQAAKHEARVRYLRLYAEWDGH
jgi:hypothetical protein